MIHDKITVILKDIKKSKLGLAEVKKEIRAMEKVVNSDYVALKAQVKGLKGQLKDMEEEHKEELKSDEDYHKLRELAVGKEEEVAQLNGKLFENVEKMPKKPFDMRVETEEGSMVVQVMPEMRVYVNGKEEKKRE